MASSSYSIEDLGERWDEFQIEEEEGGVLFDESEVLKDEVDARWCLVGRLLSDRPVDFDALRNVMASLWRPGKGMFVKELDVNKYLFQFFHEVDIQRVMEGSPWTFNKVPLIIDRLKQGENPRAVTLNKMEIWVQVYDLKVGFMSEKVLIVIGNYIGEFVTSCSKNFTGIWRDYLRVRVQIDIDKPLKRRMKIQRTKDEGYWVNFKYERVPTFCFICGVIGHSERFCHRLFEKELDAIVKPYGLFMKAPDRRSSKQIGAKWLRDNMARPLFENSGENRRGRDDRSRQDSEAGFTDVVMGNGENRGDEIRIHGLLGGQNAGGDIIGVIEAGNHNLNQSNSLVVIDNKRRRTEEEGQTGQLVTMLGQSNITLGQNLLIGDNLNKEGEDVMDQELEYNGTDQRNEGRPKNGLVAGAQRGARQGL